jgi:hypothetical protein
MTRRTMTSDFQTRIRKALDAGLIETVGEVRDHEASRNRLSRLRPLAAVRISWSLIPFRYEPLSQ